MVNGNDDLKAAAQHPQKVRVGDIGADLSLSPDQGWLDMDVQWIITR